MLPTDGTLAPRSVHVQSHDFSLPSTCLDIAPWFRQCGTRQFPSHRAGQLQLLHTHKYYYIECHNITLKIITRYMRFVNDCKTVVSAMRIYRLYC